MLYTVLLFLLWWFVWRPGLSEWWHDWRYLRKQKKELYNSDIIKELEKGNK